MNSKFRTLTNSHFIRISAMLCLLAGTFWTRDLIAQTPEEHASHHPTQAVNASPAGSGALSGSTTPAQSATPSIDPTTPPQSTTDVGVSPLTMEAPGATGGGAGGGMGGMMDGMMKKMGVPPPKEIYPTLMSLPEFTLEQRTQLEEHAKEQMHSGTVLMGKALDTLNAATSSDDFATMHDAMTQFREGIAQLESGIAARRALTESRPPRNVALAWFKQEMNLSPVASPAAHQGSGLSVFHLFTMVVLIAFAFAMFVMYFFKMRRAAALFGRIEAGKGAPPPGSAPELAGGKPLASGRPATPENKPATDTTATAQ